MNFINNCPGHRVSLHKTSYDSANNEYMTNSELIVIDFDKTKTSYLNNLHHSEEDAKSVDALAKGKDGLVYMIEFKNGNCRNEAEDIRLKVKDSVIILCDICDKKLKDARNEIVFVLVVNSGHSKLTPSDRIAIIKANKSNTTSTFLGLDRVAGLFVKKALILDRGELDRKLIPKLANI